MGAGDLAIVVLAACAPFKVPSARPLILDVGKSAATQVSWPRDLATLTRPQMQTLQTALNERGFDAGAVHGMMGPATRRAIKRYQRTLDLVPDGHPTQALLIRLQG